MYVQIRWLIMTATAALLSTERKSASGALFKKPEGLPKPIGKLTGKFNNGIADLVQQMSLGSGNGTEGWVAGAGANCAAVKVTIWPSTGSSDIKPDVDPDYKDGVIVALVRNETD